MKSQFSYWQLIGRYKRSELCYPRDVPIIKWRHKPSLEKFKKQCKSYYLKNSDNKLRALLNFEYLEELHNNLLEVGSPSYNMLNWIPSPLKWVKDGNIFYCEFILKEQVIYFDY